MDVGLSAAPRRPELAAGLVRRPRLTDRLRSAADVPLVLLSAPAGYGKTTLLLEWAEEDSRPFAWVTIGAEDNDPAHMLASVAEALHEVEPIDEQVFAALSVPEPSIANIVLPRLAGSLNGSRPPFVLVLDDVHNLEADAALEALRALADAMPPDGQLALASRTEPALPLGHMRAHRQLAELTQYDLVMTRAEGAKVLQGVGLRLGSSGLNAVVRRTEGWPAALYLAGLSLKDQRDLSRAVTRLAGDDRFVVDYLREEFMARMPRERVEFLTRISVLDRLCGPLCDAVLERSGSGGELRELARSNLLLQPLDHRDEWYRCHALFAEMLRSELHRVEPDVEAGLHRRASDWFAGQGDLDRAIHHAIHAADLGHAGELVWAAVPEYISRGRNATLQRWLGHFGDQQISASLALCLAAAHNCINRGRGDLAEHWANLAAESLPAFLDSSSGRGSKNGSQNGGSLEAGVALARATLARGGMYADGRGRHPGGRPRAAGQSLALALLSARGDGHPSVG